MVPSRKFILVCLLGLLIGAGGFWLFKNKKTEIKPPFQKGESFISGLFQKNQDDSDNDGLQDWEEILWKTDKNNPDTDGDGTLDGEEIKLNRDPSKPGPDDKLSEIKTMAGLENDSELTMTDVLARDFFAKFLTLYQSGSLNPETKEKLTESFLKNIQQTKLTDRYNSSDLKIIKDDSNEALKKYGNEISVIIKNYNSVREEHELIIINRALQKEDKSELKKLDSFIKLYEETSQNFLKTEVPQNLALYHLNILNGMFNLSTTLKNIESLFVDPNWGIIGIKQYQENYAKIENALQDISRYFVKKGVFFDKDDAGYNIFLNNRK